MISIEIAIDEVSNRFGTGRVNRATGCGAAGVPEKPGTSWTDTETRLTCYQHPDRAALLAVMEDERTVSEAAVLR